VADKLIYTLLLLMLVACAPAGEAMKQGGMAEQQPPVHSADVEAEPSQLVFEPDHVDGGSVKEGDKAVVYLRVRNAGNQMENIVAVNTSCGCSVAEPEQSLLMPGGFTRIKVTVDTFAKENDVRKWVELTDAHGHRSRAWLTLEVTENPHMVGSKRSIFDGKCGSCHFAPAAGKSTGPTIYQAVCVMCHGVNGQGAYAPKLAGHKDAGLLAAVIAAGTGSRHMPGFAKDHGGPLSPDQIAVLSRWLLTLDE